ncbi:NAD-dependent epimerase/dehydratase family protein [soil metagenome]
MRVLLTGATGLLGGELLKLLTGGGHEVRCLVRRESPNLSRLDHKRTLVYGDAGDEDALVRALDGAEAFLHVVGIEYAPQVISAMKRAGVARLVMVGSTSVHSRYEHRSGWRRRMEALVRESGLEWTIVRPTMIYGSELDKNIHKLLRFLDRSPVYPVFGPGTNLWQPVYYKDLARGVRAALEKPEAVCQSYDLPGAEPLTYLELVETASTALGRDPRIVRLPLEPVRLTLAGVERLRIPLPIESEQVMRLREDKAYPYAKARRELGYAPRTFEEGVELEILRLRQVEVIRDH